MEWWQAAVTTLAGVAMGGVGAFLGQLVLLKRRAEGERSERFRVLVGHLKALSIDVNPDGVALSIGPEMADRLAALRERWNTIRPEILGAAMVDTDDSLRIALDEIAVDLHGVFNFNNWMVADHLAGNEIQTALRNAKEHYVKIKPNLERVAKSLRGESHREAHLPRE